MSWVFPSSPLCWCTNHCPSGQEYSCGRKQRGLFAFEGISSRSFLHLVLLGGGRRTGCSMIPFRTAACQIFWFQCCSLVQHCHEYLFLIKRDTMKWQPFFQQPGVACKCSAFERNRGHGLVQTVLFVIQQQASLIQLFSFWSWGGQRICAAKRSDNFMEALNPPAGVESALAFGF